MDVLNSWLLKVMLPLSPALALCFAGLPAHAQDKARPPTSYAEQLQLNGPTGWVQTSEGRFRVLRFGTAAEPHIIRISGKSPNQVRSVRFRWGCACKENASAVFRDGTTADFNLIWFDHRTGAREWSSYGLDGLPLVVANPRTGKPIQKLYPNLGGINEITFDPPEQWQKLPAKVLSIAPQVRSTAPVTKEAPAAKVTARSTPTFAVGMRVCHIEFDAVIQEPTGIVVGGRPYMREAKGPVSFVGFVEGQNAGRIQIRIGGMNFSAINEGAGSGPVERFDYKGVQLQVGSILWDDASSWSTCR